MVRLVFGGEDNARVFQLAPIYTLLELGLLPPLERLARLLNALHFGQRLTPLRLLFDSLATAAAATTTTAAAAATALLGRRLLLGFLLGRLLLRLGLWLGLWLGLGRLAPLAAFLFLAIAVLILVVIIVLWVVVEKVRRGGEG